LGKDFHASLQKASILWKSVSHYKEISAADVAHVLFGVDDRGDKVWGGMNFTDALNFAEAAQSGEIALDHIECTNEAWAELRFSPGYMPLHRRAHGEESRCLSRPTETQSCPRSGIFKPAQFSFWAVSSDYRTCRKLKQTTKPVSAVPAAAAIMRSSETDQDGD
jgi:hypothetical protein